MKKTIIFAMMAAVLGFTACSKEEPVHGDINQIEAPRKGMVLRATVEQPTDTKATFTDNEGVWHFDFEEGDIIKVTNSEISADNFYTFTYDGEKFVSEDAVPTADPVKWYAVFPSNDVSLVGQSGAWADIADKYVMTGSTTDNVTGEYGLGITMVPEVAILKITNYVGDIDINVKTSSRYWVKNVAYNSNHHKSYLIVSETEQALLSTNKIGEYYIAVPAGQQISIKNGDEVVKSTAASGLQAGKYYELVFVPFGQGVAPATGIGNVRWIQLWEDGPKWAEYNIGATSAGECGYYYAWGGKESNSSNSEYQNVDYYNRGDGDLPINDDTAFKLWGNQWRMPKKTEFEALINNCICTWTMLYGINGMLFTGKDDYSSNSVFFPAAGFLFVNVKEANLQGSIVRCWSSTREASIEKHAYSLFCNSSKGKLENDYYPQFMNSVRAVLNE